MWVSALKKLVIALGVLPLLAACTQGPDASAPQQLTALQRVVQAGELRVLTRNTANSYYGGADGPSGIEYELAKGFAEKLGVQLVMVPAANVAEVLQRLTKGEADLAAAGLLDTKERRLRVRFTPPYQTVTQQLVYRLGAQRPSDLSHLDGSLEVVAGSGHAELLKRLHDTYPDLNWTDTRNANSEDLLVKVWQGDLDYTIVDSNEVALNQRYYPELRVAFDVGDPKPLAWAFRLSTDSSLYQAAKEYFKDLEDNGHLAQILERHYGHMDKFDYVGTRTYMRDVRERLPRYRSLFERFAVANGLDWRLLAAMAYQESHWDPDAVSPTGVRGIMMLTRATARHVGVSKRTDPLESIRGGAEYLKRLLEMVPERIQNPDRVWMALAAYNAGFGHVEDARIITEMRGGNPDRWMDVKENLPLLMKKSWYSKVKRGYARGNEALQYVENIRSYYDILVWITDQERPTTTTVYNTDDSGTPIL